MPRNDYKLLFKHLGSLTGSWVGKLGVIFTRTQKNTGTTIGDGLDKL